MTTDQHLSIITELEKLRKLAEKATPGGKWRVVEAVTGYQIRDEYNRHLFTLNCGEYALLIVAFQNLLTPYRITALIECVTALEKLSHFFDTPKGLGAAYDMQTIATRALSNLTSSCPTT